MIYPFLLEFHQSSFLLLKFAHKLTQKYDSLEFNIFTFYLKTLYVRN